MGMHIFNSYFRDTVDFFPPTPPSPPDLGRHPEVDTRFDHETQAYQYRIDDVTQLDQTFHYGDVDEQGRPIVDGYKIFCLLNLSP